MVMGLYIALQDYQRIVNFFLLNKPTAPSNHSTPFTGHRSKWILIGLQTIAVGYMVIGKVDLIEPLGLSVERQSRHDVATGR